MDFVKDMHLYALEKHNLQHNFMCPDEAAECSGVLHLPSWLKNSENMFSCLAILTSVLRFSG